MKNHDRIVELLESLNLKRPSDEITLTASQLIRLVKEFNKPTERQLEDLVVFLISKGIVSKSRLAKVLGMTLSDVCYVYDDAIEEEMVTDFERTNECND